MTTTEPTIKTLAAIMHEGKFAAETVGEAVCEMFENSVDRIASDYYDNSLEIFMEPGASKDIRATPEQDAAIRAMGFSRYWINWPDGWERHGMGELFCVNTETKP